MKSFSYTPGYIYVIAIVFSMPATWLTVGRSGDDVPGMVAMVVTLGFLGAFIIALSEIRRRLLNRRARQEGSSDIL